MFDELQARWLQNRAAEVMRAAGARGVVRVAIVGDVEMGALHERSLGVPGPTDVLTFDYSPEGGAIDAELVIGGGVAHREAAARGHSPEREALLYIVHGLLHCLGHDDHDEASAARMHAREDELLTRVGVGATFASGSAPA